MIVDRAWAERNIGFDPAKTAAPIGAYAYEPAAAPAGPEGAAFLSFTKSTGLIRLTDIPWPSGLDPQTGGKLKQRAALAANFYKAFGRWSSVCRAIVCWALIAAL